MSWSKLSGYHITFFNLNNIWFSDQVIVAVGDGPLAKKMRQGITIFVERKEKLNICFLCDVYMIKFLKFFVWVYAVNL